MMGSDPISMDELALPAFHISGATRLIRDRERLKYIRGCAMRSSHPEPQFFWDCNDRWFRAVDIVHVAKASLWLRWKGPSDLIIASYKLQQVEKPLTRSYLFRYFAYLVEIPIACRTRDKKERKALNKDARSLLKQCKSALDVMAWYDAHVEEDVVY